MLRGSIAAKAARRSAGRKSFATGCYRCVTRTTPASSALAVLFPTSRGLSRIVIIIVTVFVVLLALSH